MSKATKMMNGIGWLGLMLIVGLILASCQRDGFQPPVWYTSQRAQVEAAAQDNSEILAITHDVTDYTGGALAGQEITDGSGSPYGRATGSSLPCAPKITNTFTLDRTNPDTLVFRGKLTIDFGTGTGCGDSTVRRTGKITDQYIFIKVLASNAFTLTETLTFEGFSKGNVYVDGTFVRTLNNELVSTLDIQDVVLVYPDSTSAMFNGMLTSKIIWDGEGMNHHILAKQITGSISGVNRMATNFSATIGTPLVYKYGCFRKIPVKGTIELTVAEIESVIDFGDGDCDRVYAITSGGVTSVYSYGEWRVENDED